MHDIYEGSGWRFYSSFVMSGRLECKIGANFSCIIGILEYLVTFNIKKQFFCRASSSPPLIVVTRQSAI